MTIYYCNCNRFRPHNKKFDTVIFISKRVSEDGEIVTFLLCLKGSDPVFQDEFWCRNHGNFLFLRNFGTILS